MLKKLLVFTLGFSISVYAVDSRAKSEGESFFKEFKNFYFKNKDVMQEKIYSPASDETKSLETLSGEKIPVDMNCMESKPFAEISYRPTAGNDINLYIRMDYDFDGVYEKNTVLSGVSGICTTGVIVCNPGSVENCQFYKLSTDSSGYVVFDSPVVYTSSVASCYFVNNSGGNMSVSVPEGVSKILTDLSGLVGSIVSKTKDFVAAVGDKDFLNFTVTLVGKKPTSCLSISVDNLDKAKSYYSSDGEDDSSLTSDADAVRTGVKDIPIDGLPPTSSEGVYEFISDSPSVKTNPPPGLKSCSLNRVPVIKSIDKTVRCPGKLINIGGKEWCVRRMKTNCPSGDFSCRGTDLNEDKGAKSVSGTWFSTIVRPYQESMIVFEQYRTKGDRGGYVDISYNITGDYTANYSYHQSYSDASTMPTQFFYTPVPLDKEEKNLTVQYSFRFYGKGKYNEHTGKYYYVMFLLGRKYKKDYIANRFYHNCPSDCNLEEEYVCDNSGSNCVKTVDNGVPLSVSVSPFCYNKTTALDTYTVCADGSQIVAVSSKGTRIVLYSGSDAWFVVKRKYLCPTSTSTSSKMPTKEDFKELIRSRESIYSDPDKTKIDNYDSVTGDFRYQDVDGTWKTGSIVKYKYECKKVCRVKVKASRKPDDFSAEGYQASMNIDPSSSNPVKSKDKMDYVVLRDCVDNTCPLNPDEELLDDCFCLKTDKSLDVQSMTSLQTIYEATKDMICSDSPP